MDILRRIKKITIPFLVIAFAFVSFTPANAALMHDSTTGDVVSTDDVDVTGDFSVDSSVLTVNATTDAVNITGNDLDITTVNDIDIGADGIDLAGGATGTTVSTGDFDVTLGNVDIAAGTLDVGAALTVDTGGVTVTAGGVTVTAGGLDIDAGGIDLAAGAGDVTLNDNNLTTTGNGTFTQITGTQQTAVQPNITTLAGATAIGATGVTTTMSGPITASEGVTVTSGQTLSSDTVDLDGGAIDGVTIGANANATAITTDDLTVDGNTVIGDAAADNITMTGSIIGANAIGFEGATDDGTNITTFAITDPTAARTITFKDETGTVALLSDLTASSEALVDDIDTHVAGGNYEVSDSDGAGADVDVELYAGGVEASGDELTEVHVHSLFPTVSFKITATDQANAGFMYGPGTSEVTLGTDCNTNEIGNTGIFVCLDNGAGENLLTFTAGTGDAIVGDAHTFGFSMVAKPNDG